MAAAKREASKVLKEKAETAARASRAVEKHAII
jgi:hypothetical protein